MGVPSILRWPSRASGWTTNPKSLVRHAEQVVIERARDLCKIQNVPGAQVNSNEAVDAKDRLCESIAVLESLKS